MYNKGEQVLSFLQKHGEANIVLYNAKESARALFDTKAIENRPLFFWDNAAYKASTTPFFFPNSTLFSLSIYAIYVIKHTCSIPILNTRHYPRSPIWQWDLQHSDRNLPFTTGPSTTCTDPNNLTAPNPIQQETHTQCQIARPLMIIPARPFHQWNRTAKRGVTHHAHKLTWKD